MTGLRRGPGGGRLRAMRLALPLLLAAGAACAGEASVVGGEARRAGEGWIVSATARHADEGWEHYADAWRVETPDGRALGLRELLHPHVEEQPFTRSLSGVEIPETLDHVILRARDGVHGWGEGLRLDLPR